MKKLLIKISLLPIVIFLFAGWGKTGHSIVNSKCFDYFPSDFSWYSKWKTQVVALASDADSRKSQDPDEGIKHYIDIDNFAEFISTGKISHSIDSLAAKYGSSFVYEQGILPWATLNTYDSLVSTFKRKDWERSAVFAADLGHYIADGFMPLHVTANYNPDGIHSKFESTLINRYSSEITFEADTIVSVTNIEDSVYNYIYANNKLADSVINSCSYAKSTAGSSSNDAYYAALWQKSKGFTIKLFNNASTTLAAFIYSAWAEAGKPMEVSSGLEEENLSIPKFRLNQNYPNPFNPSTVISYSLEYPGHVHLKIYDLFGREMFNLVDENKIPGSYLQNFNSIVNNIELCSGVYLYNLNIFYQEDGINKTFTDSKKLILVK